MQQNISRRNFLRTLGVAAGAAIVGFDTTTRSWVRAVEASESAVSLPRLAGLLTAPEIRDAVSRDFGNIIQRTPIAVLRPGSIEDIAAMVRFARTHGLKIAARGQGHSTYGQPLVGPDGEPDAGVVVDMNALATVHKIGARYADVDAGVTWRALLRAALASGQTPPVLTDYIDLTVGGTLAVGGIGGMSSRYGAQIDTALALTVVTGEGKIVECSAWRNRDLFQAVLGGLGQYGIVVRARVSLVQAPEKVRVYTAFYNELEPFTRDQARLVAEERFDYLEGQVLPKETGGWMFMLEAAKYYTPPQAPNDNTLLSGLHYDAPGSISSVDYIDFAARLDPVVAGLKAAGLWEWAHPWFNVFVPGEHVVEYVDQALKQLTPSDINGLVLLYPVPRKRFTGTRLQLPKDSIVFLFSLLRFAPPVPGALDAMLASNRRLYEQVVELGGKNYPIGAIPNLDSKDWKQHYRPGWGQVVSDKRHYDPDNVLTPGQGIFRVKGRR